MLRTVATITFGLCHTGGGFNCVVDGDTLWVRGEKVRIADIDAPETHQAKCQFELALGQRATQRLFQMVNRGDVELRRAGRDKDRNGRLLRTIWVDGRNIGQVLVREGLARPWTGKRKPWC